MTDPLPDDDLAWLCAIGEYDLAKASEAQKQGLARLPAGGFVERDGARLKPTAKGVDAVTSRGGGLNEG
jgi:hypothetical protein